MSRWTNPFTRKRVVILALLVLTAAAIYTWQVMRTRDPAILTYCLKYGPYKPNEDPHQVQPMSSCLETKTLKIPAAYYGVWLSGPGNLAPEATPIEVAYPSMQPWATVPWLEQSKTQKIEIQLEGVDYLTVAELWRLNFLGTLKPIHVAEPLFGLNRYDSPYGDNSWWSGMHLLPLEPTPRVKFTCSDKGLTLDPIRTQCTGTTHTNWHFRVVYRSPRFLLPQWQGVHAKVIALVDSFVITP